MDHHRWIVSLLLLLSRVGPLGAEPVTGVGGRPITGVFGTHAKITTFKLPEVTAAVFGPGENPACPDGRLVFAAGKFVQVANLAGESLIVDGHPLGATDLNPLTGEANSSPIWDAHLARVGNDLVHSVIGFTYTNLACMAATSNCQPPCVAKNVVENGAVTAKCQPKWWTDFTEYPHRDHQTPGARSALWVFRSGDCGLTWSLANKVDAATLTVKDPAGKATKGFCGVPRLWEQGVACKDSSKKDVKDCPSSADQVAIKKLAEVGGWDGPYLGVDPETGRMVISTLCAFGTGVSKTPAPGVNDSTGLLNNNDLRHHIFVVLDEDGKPKSQAALPQPDKKRPSLGIWRGAVMPLGEDQWAFAYGENEEVKLLIDDPLNGSFSKPIRVASFQEATAFDPPWKLFHNPFAVGWDLALNRVPVGSASVPGLPGAHQPFFRPLVQVASYTWKDGEVLRYQIHNVDPKTGSSHVVSTIRSDVGGESVTEGAFIQGHRASLFYWLEEREGDKFAVRYQVYSQGKPLLNKKIFNVFAGRQKPGVIKIVKNGKVVEHQFKGDDTPIPSNFQGDYMKGAHYLGADDVEHFFLVWNQNGDVAFAEVRVSGLNDLPIE